MRIFVISRASDVQRREAVSSTLKNSPYVWGFFDAYEAGTIPEWFEAVYDEKKAKKYRSYPLVPGEKGCFSSHIGVWLRCVNLDEPVVVLEDDFTLLSDFYNKLNIVGSSGFDYVKLEKRSGGFDIDENFMVNTKNRSGAVGYYLSPVGAFKLLSGLKKVYMPVDHYLGMPWKHGVSPIGLSCQIINHEGKFDTNIQGDRKSMEDVYKKNKVDRLLRKARRYVDDFRYRKYIKLVMQHMKSGGA